MYYNIINLSYNCHKASGSSSFLNSQLNYDLMNANVFNNKIELKLVKVFDFE